MVGFWKVCTSSKLVYKSPEKNIIKIPKTELDMEQWTCSKLGNEYVKAVLSPCLFNLYAEYIMWNAGLDEAYAGNKIAGRNINNFRYADDTTLTAESEEELKASWWKWKKRVKYLA